MFQIEQNIERTKNLYKKSQKNPGRFSKTSLLAMAFFALATLVNADNVKLVTPEPQSMTTDGSTAVISTQQPSNRMHPNELVLYYDGKNGGHINPKSLFSVCTISDSGGNADKFKGLNYGKDRRIGLLNQEKNPRFPLHLFSMSTWQKLYQASESSINDDVVLSISNQGKRPLFVTLPEFISMRLFIFGNVVIENNACIENGATIIGVDPRRMDALSSGCPFYADRTVPSTVRIKGRLRGGVLVVGSPCGRFPCHVVLEKGLPKNWRLSNASVRVLDGQDEKNDGPFGIKCYGPTKVVCAKTTRINGDVELKNQWTPFRTDPDDGSNNGVAHFDNVIFAPKKLVISFPFDKFGGDIFVKGQVDLTDTTIHIEDLTADQPMTKDTRIGLTTHVIRSDRPIIGRPKIKCGPHWQIKCKIEGNNLSIIGDKQLSGHQQKFPKGFF